MADVNNPLSFC